MLASSTTCPKVATCTIYMIAVNMPWKYTVLSARERDLAWKCMCITQSGHEITPPLWWQDALTSSAHRKVRSPTTTMQRASVQSCLLYRVTRWTERLLFMFVTVTPVTMVLLYGDLEDYISSRISPQLPPPRRMLVPKHRRRENCYFMSANCT